MKGEKMGIPRVLKYAHQLISERVIKGDTVVDGTCGNGYDTLFLAKAVGENGKVIGFDIQDQAINSTMERMIEQGVSERVNCVKDSHANVQSYLKNQPIGAAMFNLGYLPGAEKEITTKAKSTTQALTGLLKLLRVGGIITLVIYTEHDQGEEAKQVEDYVKELPQKQFQVLKYGFINQIHHPPYLIAIERIK